jgi:carboxyl-terminal processing protease
MKRTTSRSPYAQKIICAVLGSLTFSGWSALPVFAEPSNPAVQKSIPADSQSTIIDAKNLIDEVWQIVNRSYVDPSFNRQDWVAIRQQLLSRKYQTKAEAYQAIQKALGKLGDRYTLFMDPKQFGLLNNGSELAGIGLRLGLNKDSNIIKITEALPDTPASKAGIQSNDILVEVDGKPTQGKSVMEVTQWLRGKVGEFVTVVTQRGETQQTIRIARAKVTLKSVLTNSIGSKSGRIGYIRMNDFALQSETQSKEAINNLEKLGVAGYILDMRGNPGGLFEAVIGITRQWLDQGEIVTLKTRDNIENRASNQQALTKKPLVVLVDGNTASGSELLAIALQENKRAQLVGTTTFGQNAIGSVHPLMSDNSGVTVTIAKWLSPKGNDISGKGITPDVVIELSEAQLHELSQNPNLIGTIADPQMAKAIDVLEKRIEQP